MADDKTFIHIPKTGGTSIRETLGLQTKFYHKRLKDYDKVPSNTFTVIRNPFDRAVSLCAHEYGSITPELFLKWCEQDSSPRLYKRFDISFSDPILDFITIDNKVAVDIVIRFENLESEIKKIFNKELLYLNKGNRTEYKQYYNEQSYQIISNRYMDDIKTFGYTF